jgi:branched-chain amino acid transport system substrate-binding protein
MAHHVKQKSNRIGWIGLIILLTTGVLILSHTAPVDAEPIKIGLLYSTTGKMAPFASYYREGALLAIEQTNQAGGINDNPIEVIDYDAESNPEIASRKAMKMVQKDGVVAIAGPGTAYVAGGMMSTIEKLETPFTAVHGTLSFAKVVPKWLFSSEYFLKDWFTASGTDMRKNGINNFVLLSSADRVGQAGIKLSKYIEDNFGVKFSGHDLRPISDTEFTTVWAKLLAAHKPEAVYILSTPPSFTTPAVNNLYDLGFEGPWFYAGGGRLKFMMKGISKKGGENLRFANPKYIGWDQLRDDDPDRERVESFGRAYVARYKKDPETAAIGYDTAMQIIDAIKAVGPDRAKIRDFLENLKDWKGAQGSIFTRSDKDHTGSWATELPLYSWDTDKQKFKILEYVKLERR